MCVKFVPRRLVCPFYLPLLCVVPRYFCSAFRSPLCLPPSPQYPFLSHFLLLFPRSSPSCVVFPAFPSLCGMSYFFYCCSALATAYKSRIVVACSASVCTCDLFNLHLRPGVLVASPVARPIFWQSLVTFVHVCGQVGTIVYT